MQRLEKTPNSDYPIGHLQQTPGRPRTLAEKASATLQACTTTWSTQSAQIMLRMKTGLSSVDVDAGWRQWGTSATEMNQSATLWGGLIDELAPWPTDADPPATTFPPLLQADPMARVAYLDLSDSREQYLSIAFSITTMAWSNCDLWRMAKAKDRCLRERTQDQRRKYRSILAGMAEGDRLEWMETATRIPDRPC